MFNAQDTIGCVYCVQLGCDDSRYMCSLEKKDYFSTNMRNNARAAVTLLWPETVTDMAFTKTLTKLVLLDQFQKFSKYMTWETYA